MEKKEKRRLDSRGFMNSSVSKDILLVRKARKDKQAAQALLERLLPKVRHMVYLLVGGDQDAGDLVQVCLVEILENLSRYRGEGSVEGWAGKISYRVIMRQMKRRRRSERILSLVAEEAGVAASDPAEQSARREIMERLRKHMQEIPVKRRITLILRLVYEHSVAEVAEITGVPVNTARDRLRVGLRELRSSLSNDPASMALISGESNGRK